MDSIEVTKAVFDGWNVTRAKLHQSVQVPLFGEAESLYEKPGSGIGRAALTGVTMKMNTADQVLYCEYKGNAFVIPLANVSIAYL